ncbi:MAG: hypothetical protein Q4D66_03525, partial [Bacteroidales bacterium]|nr:hypothetical protein [Bacteroidales bacterium]
MVLNKAVPKLKVSAQLFDEGAKRRDTPAMRQACFVLFSLGSFALFFFGAAFFSLFKVAECTFGDV